MNIYYDNQIVVSETVQNFTHLYCVQDMSKSVKGHIA